MPMIDEVLSEAGVDVADLAAIGVGVGPGNFTGIRISVSAARGLSLALGIPAIGVSLLEALRYGHDGPSLSAIDARRSNLYLQSFGTGRGRGPEMVSFEDISHWAEPGLSVIGNRCHEIADTFNMTARPAAFAPASAIARIASARWQSPAPRPAPLYVRAADAAPSKDSGPKILT